MRVTSSAQNGPATRPGETTIGFSDAPSSLVPYFQPFYNLSTGRVQGVEALARHRTDDGRIESPAGVLAEGGPGAAQKMDLQILDASLRALAHLQQDSALHDLILSVNLSDELLDDPTSADKVVRSLSSHGVAGHRLLVDITTDMFRGISAAHGEASGHLHRFQEQEIAFCLDNFTVDDLDLLPLATSMHVDIIKLAPRVLSGDAGALARIADAVQEAGLPMVAAGIETQEQLDRARELGVEWAQGFLLGEPAPADVSFAAPVELTV